VRVLVTGAGGFVGKHVTQAALDAGHQVHGLFRSPPANVRPGVGSAVCDLSDREGTATCLKAMRPDVVLHTAARIPARAGEDAYTFLDDNVRGTLHLLSAAKESRVRHFVFSSSMSVYGHPSYLPVDEEHPCVPSSAYGVSKLEGEMYARLAAEEGALRVTVLRYSGVFGEGQKSGAVPTFIARCARDEPLTLHAGGRPSSDYVWVKDVARANLLAMVRNEGEAFAVYNVGGGVETSVATLAEIIRSASDSRSEIRPSPDASLRDFRFAYDIERAKNELGYQPTDLKGAIAECVRVMAPRD
jgi:UDP-glucose 4-epimerase